MMNQSFTAPVVEIRGDGSVDIKQIPLGQMDPVPIPKPRDDAEEREAVDRWFEDEQRKRAPELFAARQLVKRRTVAYQQWVGQANDLRQRMQDKTSQMGNTPPSAPMGTREERQYELRKLAEQLEDVEAECAAAGAELESAQAVVSAELAKVAL